MNPFGDGSDGVLNVTSGTTNLLLNRKYQYKSVNVASGATLSTSSTTGAVLYITAQESITINGTINVSNKVGYGNNTWDTTIDGVIYFSPGVAIGGRGFGWQGQAGEGLQKNGFGGGGGADGNYGTSGGGGNATGSTPTGGAASTATRTSSGTTNAYKNGSNGGGGGGLATAIMNKTAGSGKVTATSGAGGSGFGGNGGAGGSGGTSGNWGGTYDWFAGGGGGAGGRAGKSGVNVVLVAPKIIINGTVITSGTAGTKGGNGGRSRSASGWLNSYGGAGGGGGGGNAGSLNVRYATEFTDNTTLTAKGGAGGAGGLGGPGNGDYGTGGADGSIGFKNISQLKPYASFTATPTTGMRPLDIQFTNQSLGATSYLWGFGDGDTSTDINPTHTYATQGTYTVTLTASNDAGDTVETKTNYVTATVATHERTATASLKLSATITRTAYLSRNAKANLKLGVNVQSVVLRDVQKIEEKRYLYKVYDESGTYIETWKDVIDDLQFTTEINSLGSSTTIELARNSDSVGTVSDILLAEDGTPILTEAGQTILVSTQSKNQVGPGSSVQHNNRVDVYVFYGEVSPLLTEAGEEITTEDDEVILATIGAPNGRRIFSGFISGINQRYGNTETTVVELSTYGYDLEQYVIDDGGDTTVKFLSEDPSNIAKEAVDRFVTVSSGDNTYTHRTETSISSTGTVVSYTFRVNHYGDVLKKVLELMPPNWYFYVGLGDNVVYFREMSQTPHHLFYLGKHIESLDLKTSILDVRNDVYFTGGDVGGNEALFKRYTEAPAPRTRRGLELYSDSRVTLTDSAQIISEGIIDSKNKVQYRTTVQILAKAYDIESISVGEVVGFRNFGNVVDSLKMQIQGINYSPDVVTLALDSLPPTINKRLQDLQRNMKVEENAQVPDSPQ